MTIPKYTNILSDKNDFPPRLRGSFTVEATLVVGFIILVLFMTLRMTFFLTDSVRMEALLSEGSLWEIQESNTGKSRLQTTSGFFLLSPSHIQIRNSTNQVTVSLSQGSFQIWPGGQSYFETEYNREIRKPVTFLRQCHLLTTWK